MELYLISFLAGVLTILAPCVLPLLPVIIGGSVSEKSPWRPFVITFSLMVSVVIFTLLLKVSTALIDVPLEFWARVSGFIILFFGIITLFPNLWKWISSKLGFDSGSQKLLHKSSQKKGIFGSIALGASLGPVFASCSPTYAIILATVLPQNFLSGVVHIIIYALGLSVVMFLIAFFGQKIVVRLKWAADPNGTFKKILGVIFILVGIGIMTGADKALESWLVQRGITGITDFEIGLTERFESLEQ